MADTSYPKDKIKILLLENIHPVAAQAFEGDGFHVERLDHALSEDELIERLPEIHVLGIRSKTQISEKALSHTKRLLSIGCFCIGTNQVDLVAANQRGIPVFNAPFSNTRSVAELVVAELVMLARRLGDRSSEMHRGVWSKIATGSHEIRGKTLGIVGYGHIGSQVGVLAESMGLRVIFHDVIGKLPMGNNKGSVPLPELLAQSDFVTLHVPATYQTVDLIGARELAQMKPGACLINASRGNVVEIPALAAALKEGHLGGAAVDVFPKEPASNAEVFESELRGLPNVILTPHIGGSTEEAQEAIGHEVTASLMGFINTGSTHSAVNFPQVDLALRPGSHRILNVHRNVPGVMRDINQIVTELHANIRGQVLGTDSEIGYLIMDLDRDVSNEVHRRVSALPTNIRTRILY